MMKKVLSIVAAVLFAAYLIFSVFLSRSASEKTEVEECKCVVVEVRNKSGYDLMNKASVLDLLNSNAMNPEGMLMGEIDTESMEEFLKTNPLISHVDCYKTTANMVCVNLVTKIPILRVKNNTGADFYVDNRGELIYAKLHPMDIPLVTGFVNDEFASEKLYELALFLQTSDFWRAQIAQINVTEDGQVELVPRVGNHLLILGEPSDYEQKLSRLAKFYEDGLGIIGWNKYSSISVAFNNQVVCKKK